MQFIQVMCDCVYSLSIVVFSLFGELRAGVMIPYSRREQSKVFAAVYANLQYEAKEVSSHLYNIEELLYVCGSAAG